LSPETAAYLAKARRTLVEAETMLQSKLYEAAGRAAYLAGFHAAQALISERTGRGVKTHRGVRTEFHRLTKDVSGVDDELRAFLAFGYDLKTAADYEVGPAEVAPETARVAIDRAKRFVAKMAELIGP
jgi:uncharacterized protein (UPF0332 family)